MGILDEMLQDDFQNVFTSADHSFEVESVTYKPHNTEEVDYRTFPVQVWRFPPELDVHTGMSRAARIEIEVARSSTATIGITTVNIGVDRVAIATNRGGTVEDHPVEEIMSSDAGGFRLKLT